MTAIAVSSVHAKDVAQPVIVNVENFARAETSAQFDRILQMTGGINQFVHLRGPTSLDRQNVIRMNRDTVYSATIVDISNGATLTVPDEDKRYMFIMVVNDHKGYQNMRIVGTNILIKGKKNEGVFFFKNRNLYNALYWTFLSCKCC